MTRQNQAGFPATLTADMLQNFVTTACGCTHPRVGEIGGRRYIAKCGAWSDYSSDEHVLNELVADEFLRAAGLNVPVSKGYRVDLGGHAGVRVIRLAEFKDDTVPLGEAWKTADEALRTKLREQALAAYPVQAVVAGIDTFTWDNVRVDRNGNLWFVDNGASFDFRACGLRKGWFWMRGDVDDPRSGYLSLARHPSQRLLRRVLGGVDAAALWKAAADANLTRLAQALPSAFARPALVAYIQFLADIAAQRAVNPPPPRTELVFVLDRSGSMGGVVNDVIGGFNSVLAKQQQEAGECRVSTVLFDDRVSILHDRTDIRAVRPITTREYTIGGSTALLDALGKAVSHQINVQRQTPWDRRADKVVFAVITDGGENASRTYTAEFVRRLVKTQTEEWGWEFLFLGANIDAVATAADVGIQAARAVDFVCDDGGIGAGYEAVDRAMRNVRRRRRVEEPDEQGRRWREDVDRDFRSR